MTESDKLPDAIQKMIWNGQPIRLQREPSGNYVPIVDLAAATGIAKKSFFQTLDRNGPLFSEHERDVQINTPGGRQWTRCIDRDGCLMLLTKISVNSVKSDEARKKLTEFQKWMMKLMADGIDQARVIQQGNYRLSRLKDEREIADYIIGMTGADRVSVYAAVLRKCGLEEYSPFLRLESSLPYLSVSDIAKKIGKTPHEVNIHLWQFRKFQIPSDADPNEYHLTPPGKLYGEEIPFISDNGHKGMMIRWRPTILELFNVRPGI